MRQLSFLLFASLLGLAVAGSITVEQEETHSNSSIAADHADAKLTVPEIVEKYGYPVEIHTVVTEDGYILQLHRIPYGKNCGAAEGKRVIFLQHGLLADSSNWIIAGPEKGLAYNLADECYDVWMGNFRGNTYSKNHTEWSPSKNKKKFWRFSYDQMGLYDLPASIDYVLENTGVEQIYYTGHSMGTTAFFILMSEKPEYNARIKIMNAFAPVAYTEHMISPIRLLSLIEGPIENVAKLLGMYELLPSNKFMEWMGQTMCKETSPVQEICNNVVFLLAGYNYEQMDRELLPSLMGHMPAGTSVDTILHFSQGVKSGDFKKYDFGMLKNLATYKSLKPPKYDISKITAPVALWWGQNDWLAAAKDVNRLAPELPNLQLNYRINHDNWNHFDFIIAKDMVDYVNKPVISFMENY